MHPIDFVTLWRLIFSFFALGYLRSLGHYLAPLVVGTGLGWCMTRGCLEGFWPLLGVYVFFFLGGSVWYSMLEYCVYCLRLLSAFPLFGQGIVYLYPLPFLFVSLCPCWGWGLVV